MRHGLAPILMKGFQVGNLDEGAASVYIGVDECYQNYASDTEMPIVTPREVEKLVANGILQVVSADDIEGMSNVGVISGSGESSDEDAGGTVQSGSTPEDTAFMNLQTDSIVF